MPTIFIVRPFGQNRPVVKKRKEGEAPEVVFFNFDKVETDLLQPAIQRAGLQGGTTLDIFESGEVKEDMFSRLLTADVVIADISIHNANVFYELGIRHALRGQTTVLVKAAGFDETPFDIIGYRYLTYQKDDPAAALDALTQTLKDSAAADRKDSPVFNMLPKLREPETERFLVMPPGFGDEVSEAVARKDVGRLLLLSSEAEFFPWMNAGLRLIGQAFFEMKQWDAGRIVWEKLKERKPNDLQAADRLATIYQRLSDREEKTNPPEAAVLLDKSDRAVETLMNNLAALDATGQAEAFSLKGRNDKTKWINAWENEPPEQKAAKALRSSFLKDAIAAYESAYLQNINHFYSGVNALGLLSVQVALAQNQPALWKRLFSTPKKAEDELEELKEKSARLAGALELAFLAAEQKQEMTGKKDVWLGISRADFRCLTGTDPEGVAIQYEDALTEARDFVVDAVANQLRCYEQLSVLTENVKAALGALRPVTAVAETNKTRYLLFTGHMIDKADRAEPRFPKEKEAAARQRIKAAVEAEKAKADGPVVGISGGACGGDILFHEVCAELGIPTELYLALPADQFKAKSVNFAGPQWTERFDALYTKLPHHTLCDKEDLPAWLQKKKGYSIWERNNLWLLNNALVNGGLYMTLIALWDGKVGNGPGGTQHMVKEAEARGAKTVVIDVKDL